MTLGYTGITSEPSAANNGNVVFMTGNTWAARSTDGGDSFLFVDPFSDFPKLCCDQDVVYNDIHDVWIWYRQGFEDATLGGSKNNVTISVSTDDAVTWCTYTLTASDIDAGLTDHFIDYPHLQTTDDKLYISTNFFGDLDTFSGVLRFDLDDLSECKRLNFQTFLQSTEFNYTPVNGATDTMYFGTQISAEQTKIYSWKDSSTSVSSMLVTYPAYKTSGYLCQMPDTGTNPCDRSDTRIVGGYLSNGVLGFVWDAAQGEAFLYPYVYYITVDVATGDLLASSPFFSNSTAINFANFGVNNAGDIGIGLFQMGGNFKPSYLVGIDDAQTNQNEFDFIRIKTSTDGPGADTWGDYVRVKPYKPDNGQWVATGFTMQGGTGDANVENLFVVFGRSADICTPPVSGTWTVTASCRMTVSITAPGNVLVQNNSVLTIPSGITLDISFTSFNLTVESGSGVLVESDGKIT